MIDWIAPASGTALLCLLAWDVFMTAFHAEGRGGPINRRQNRLIWQAVRTLGTLGGLVRSRVLSLGGPVIAITTIAVWTATLLTGFALIYLPWILDFHISSGSPQPRLLEAFYYSAIIAGTVGQGDVVAPTAVLRAVTILQAMSGFALVTVAVSYVLAVYRELIASTTLAGALHARVPRSGTDRAQDSPGEGWSRSITFRLSHSLESHFNYPILHYFRPTRHKRALPVQLARLSDWLHSAEAADSPATPSVDALRSISDRYVEEVHSLFVRQATEPEASPEDPEKHMREILRMMVYPEP